MRDLIDQLLKKIGPVFIQKLLRNTGAVLARITVLLFSLLLGHENIIQHSCFTYGISRITILLLSLVQYSCFAYGIARVITNNLIQFFVSAGVSRFWKQRCSCLPKKLKNIKLEIKDWSKGHFGNFHDKITKNDKKIK